MYNTAKELHIGIDLGLQEINSNRKLEVEPAEKDWVLNTVLMQEINSRINPNSNPKGEGFEDTIKRINDLESLKKDTHVLGNNRGYSKPIFPYGTHNVLDVPTVITNPNAVHIHLPSDCYSYIGATARVNYLGDIKSPVVNFKSVAVSDFKHSINYATMRIAPDSDAAYLYKGVKLKLVSNVGVATQVLFDMEEVTSYKDSLGVDTAESYRTYGMNPIIDVDARFTIINLMMDAVNANTKTTGISAYWEHFGTKYEKDSIIFVMNTYVTYKYLDSTPTASDFVITYTDGNPSEVNNLYSRFYEIYTNNDNFLFTEAFIADSLSYTDIEKVNYANATFKEYPVRIVKSSELNKLLNHQYGTTVYNSPIGVIRNGSVIVYSDSKFEIDRIDLEYYKKPRAISLLNNQGCEVSSESFRMELVDKTVQKLSARINDPAYQNLTRENLILE